MLKHILVPLDGSKLAEEALDYAREVVAPDGKITLVCAVEVPDIPVYGYYPATTVSDSERTKNELVSVAENYLEGLAADMIDKGVFTRFEATLGDPVTVISAAAERLAVDAIVMSTHGRSGIGRFLFGSVTNKILEAKLCPVFVIPNRENIVHEKTVEAVEHIN
jgi:nucleotide-binding universal stress UspA family protein